MCNTAVQYSDQFILYDVIFLFKGCIIINNPKHNKQIKMVLKSPFLLSSEFQKFKAGLNV